MKVLIIGGTGLISTGIVKHLLARGADITVFNRSKRENTLPTSVKALVGNRDEAAALTDRVAFERRHPLLDDRPMPLMVAGIRSTWRNRGYNLRGKLFHTIWFPLAALLPQAAATNIIRRGLMPGAGA